VDNYLLPINIFSTGKRCRSTTLEGLFNIFTGPTTITTIFDKISLLLLEAVNLFSQCG